MKRMDEESIVQQEKACWLCGNENPYELERHEVFFGNPYRQLSIEYMLTVLLCGDSCHRNGAHAVHRHRGNDLQLKREAQQAAMHYYGWNTTEFVETFGRNYLDTWED